MAEVSWQARRTQDSVLVDVTADIEGSVQGAPTPNPIEGGAVEQVVYSTSTALTNDQIKALPTTPIELVPAPGADRVIVVQSAFVRIDSTGGGDGRYGNIDAGAYLLITYAGEGVTPAQGLIAETEGMVTTLLRSLDNSTMHIGPYTTASLSTTYMVPALVSVSDITNKALQLKADNASAGAFTGGNAANSGSITVLYTVVEL